jgi:hypothetical protein
MKPAIMQVPPAFLARVVMVVHVLRRFALTGAAAALAFVTPSLNASTAQDTGDVTPLPRELQQQPQNFSDDVPAHISVVDGQADLEHDGKVERAEANMLLLAGDRLRTSRGRLEVLFDDGSALHLDEQSTVDLLSASLIRLREGRLRLLVARTSNPIEYRIDATAGSTLIRSAGEYRLAVQEGRSSDFDLRVIVLRGVAEVSNESGRTTVRTGSEVFASLNRAPSPPYSINSAMTDSFERWAQDQIDARLSVESARYVPEDVRYDAGVFDTYGSWGYESSYGGYVWYPSVAYGWRPYHYGKWRYYGHYGWTWHGYDRWSWATHHYGRWGYAGRWYWVPHGGWGPAWVAWGYAPGYVSWCPLGWGGRAVFGFSVGVRYGSIYGGPTYGPWNAWTVVPARSFVPAVNPHVVVAQHAVAPNAISAAVRTQFAEARRTPAAPNMAVSRAEPLRSPTGPRAVPRGLPSNGIAGGAGAGVRAGARGGVAMRSSGAAASRTAPSRDAATSRSRAGSALPVSPGAERASDARARTDDSRSGSSAATDARETRDPRTRAMPRSGIEDPSQPASSRSRVSEAPESAAPRSRTFSSMPVTTAPRGRVSSGDGPAPGAPRSRIESDRQPATSRAGSRTPEARPGAGDPPESRSRSYGMPSGPRAEPIMGPSRSIAAPRGRTDGSSSASPGPAPRSASPSGPPSRSGSGGAVGRPSAPSGGGSGGGAPAAAPSRTGGGSGGGSSGAAAPRRGRGGL